MLALPKLSINLAIVDQLQGASFTGRVVATARFPDEVEPLIQASVSSVFNIYSEAGAGFAAHVVGEGIA